MFSVKSSEWSCICVLWYGYIICPLFLQFWNCSDSVVFWNCSDSVVSFTFHFTNEICRKLIKGFHDVIHLIWYLYNIRYKYTSISPNSYIVHFSYLKTKWITWIHSTLHVYLLLCELCLSRCLCFFLTLFSHFLSIFFIMIGTFLRYFVSLTKNESYMMPPFLSIATCLWLPLKGKNNKSSIRSLLMEWCPWHILIVYCGKYETCITKYNSTSDTVTQICITYQKDILNNEHMSWSLPMCSDLRWCLSFLFKIYYN